MCRKEALVGPSSWELVRHLIEERWWAGSRRLQAGLEEADNGPTEPVPSPNPSLA